MREPHINPPPNTEDKRTIPAGMKVLFACAFATLVASSRVSSERTATAEQRIDNQ